MLSPMDRSERAQLADLIELAGSPDLVLTAVATAESTHGRRPHLAEVVQQIMRDRARHELLPDRVS